MCASSESKTPSKPVSHRRLVVERHTQAGVPGVCATLGTALTIEQARMLKRYAPEIWVSYDGDAAGQKAILRALEIFDEENVEIPTRPESSRWEIMARIALVARSPAHMRENALPSTNSCKLPAGGVNDDIPG